MLVVWLVVYPGVYWGPYVLVIYDVVSGIVASNFRDGSPDDAFYCLPGMAQEHKLGFHFVLNACVNKSRGALPPLPLSRYLRHYLVAG